MLETHRAVFNDPNFIKGRMMNIPNNANNLPQPKFECEIAGIFLYGFFRTDYAYYEDRATTKEDAVRIWFSPRGSDSGSVPGAAIVVQSVFCGSGALRDRPTYGLRIQN